ncbi:PAS domain-containing protein [Rhodocytophaga rosea]|uniref:histidine kinase n=1 Tax=Rhodocytophaga rosea TaxID=2704465 RepID=A0A6C0GLE7_9BACT|nr:PAS domain-containing protein [Rhodocytophaga rosea]QHT68452.1 PAS domain-containing protein [Rhodocytophaga rosea]
MKNSVSSLIENQLLLQSYAQAPVAIGIYLGKNYTIAFANPVMREIWGRNPEQVLDKPLFEALPEVAGQGFEEILEEVWKTGKSFSGNEMPAPLERNGRMELCYFNILYQPVREEAGEVIGIIQLASEVTTSVKARQKAERNEELLKTALEAGKMGTWHEDLVQGTITRSVGYDRIFGYEEALQEWNQAILLAHIVAEDKKVFKENYQQGLKNGYLDCEVRIRRVDKSIHWVHFKGEAYYNMKGTPMGISGIIMDITERKQESEREKQMAMEQSARKEAEKQTKLLQDMFRDAPAMICILKGPEHTFELVNTLYQQLFSNRVLIGKTLLEALPELRSQPFKEILDGVYQTGKPFIGKEVPLTIDRFNTGQMEKIYVNFVYQAMRDIEGEINGILVFAFEVTEQIEVRQKIEHSEENLRLALEAGKMGTWQLDLQTDQSLRSLHHDQIFGYQSTLPEWGIDTFIAHVVPEDRENVKASFSMARSTGTLQLECQIIRADGERRWISVKGQVFYEQEQPVRIAGVVLDITESKQGELALQALSKELAKANKELIAANDEIHASNEALLHTNENLAKTNEKLTKVNIDLDNFVYAASHDLKSPVTSLIGLLKYLRRNSSGKLDEKGQELLDMIDLSAGRLQQTIHDLTQIAKVQRQTGEEKETIFFPDLLTGIQSDLQELIQESGVQIKLNLCVERIFYSRQNVRSILFNLISNAIKYRSPDRRAQICLATYEENGRVILKITDNGLGLSASQQQNLFTMFKRFHNHVEGSGIGLYMIKRMLENNGGTIEAESVLGEGTTFTVQF